MDAFLIREDPYFGLAKRPQVPEEEVWVFRWADGEFTVVSYKDEYTRSPAAPLLRRHAMTIYKFKHKITFSRAITLFTDLGLSPTINTSVTLFLNDPVQYMITHDSHYTDLPTHVQSIIENALQEALEEEGQARGVQLSSGRNRDITIPLALSQLSPGTDLSRYIQKEPTLKKQGLEARILVRETSIPHSYKQFLQDATLATQTQLSPIKQEVIALLTSLERQKIQMGGRFDPTGQEPELQKELYRNHAEPITRLRSKLYMLIENIIMQSKVATVDSVPLTLITAIFNDLIYQLIERQVAQFAAASHPPLLPGAVPAANNDRTEQIRAIYNAADDNGWRLSPASPEKVKEEMSIDLGNKGRLRLIVPSAYPSVKPVINDTRKQRDRRLPQGYINKVTMSVITSDNYDLQMLVQAVVDKLPDTTIDLIT